MGQLATAIGTLFAAQRAYEEARARRALSEELVVLAEAMSTAIIAHGIAMQSTPQSQWKAEADAVHEEDLLASAPQPQIHLHIKDDGNRT